MKRVIFFSFLLIAICGNAMAQEPVQSAQPAKISIVFTPIATEIALADALAANHTSVVLFGLPKVDNPQSDIDRTWNAINGKVEEVKTYLGPHQADSRLNFFYYEGSRTDRELAARFKLLVRTVTGQKEDQNLILPAMVIVRGSVYGNPIRQFVKAQFIGVDQCKNPFLITIGAKEPPQPESEPELPEVQVVNLENELMNIVRSGVPSYLVFCRLYEAPCGNAKIAFGMRTSDRPVDIPVYIVDLRMPDGHTKDFRHEHLVQHGFFPPSWDPDAIYDKLLVGVLVAGYKEGMNTSDVTLFRLSGQSVVQQFASSVQLIRESPKGGPDTVPLFRIVE